MHNDMTRAKCIVDYKYFTKSLRVVAMRYGVGKSSVQRWVQNDVDANGVLQRRKQYAKRASNAKNNVMKCINETLQERPFITMNDLATLLFEKCGAKFSGRSINRFALQADYTYKKAVTCVDHTHDNVKVMSFCSQFQDAVKTGQLYCIDEAGFYVGDHPRKGRAKRGKRLAIGTGKKLRKSKFTLVMAIGIDGIVACEILDYNCKKPDFVKFIESINLPHGSVILMDNLKIHHSIEIQDIATRRGFKMLFTPPYSPRCNPIEKIFGEFKPLYRKLCGNLKPPHEDKPLNKEDLHGLFVGILMMNEYTSFKSTFINTLRFIKETVKNIETYPNFKFIGYDISSFVRLHVDLIQ